ncbi:MAG TPA: phage holin family protein [Jatrophihabitantaceae bacterium]
MSRSGQPVVAYPPANGEADGLSTSQLVSRLTEELSRLVRDELRLAQTEVLRKGKLAGVGVGALGGAGLLAFYGGACLLAAAIVALATVISPWAAALTVGIALLVAAGIGALVAKVALRRAIPGRLPKETVESLQADLHTVLEHAKRPAGSKAGAAP